MTRNSKTKVVSPLLFGFVIFIWNNFPVNGIDVGHSNQFNLTVLSNLTEVLEVGCMNITDFAHGNITLVESNSSHVIHFSCFPGYILMGKSMLPCNGDQLDNEDKPYCVQEDILGCEEPPMIANGEVRVEGFKEGQLYAEGLVVEYQCIVGFHLVPAIKHRTCKKGRWSGVDPICQPDGCSKPINLVNGHFVPDINNNRYPTDSYIHFTCDIGYILKGADTLKCLSTGYWSEETPQCIRSQEEGLACAPPPLGQHVVVTAVRGMQSANSALSGTTLEASCAPGYRDQAFPCVPSLLRCIDGNWHGRFANCVSVDSCMYPLNIPHATVLKVGLQSSVYSLGSQVAYSCHADYQLVGDAVFTCQSDGCWVPDILPVCHPRHPPTHFYMNGGAWSDYIKLNTTLLVSMITIASVSIVVVSVCLVVVCRPHPSPHSPPLAPPPADPDRVALIAFADGVQSVLPSYEEAVRGSVGGVLNYRLHRPHWTTMLGGQRRNNRDTNRQTSSVRDSMGSTDTVTVSEVSTNVTVDTVSSHSGSQTASCHAICGSLTSFDTSSIINTEGVPLLEVNELEEVTSSQGSAIVLDPDLKIQSDISSIHS